jgi:DNA-binding CsgD family transcriptional regulator
MTEPPPAAARVAAEVAAIAAAAGPVSLETRAQELLEALHPVVPFEAGWLGLLDPERREHVPLAVQGYDDRFRGYITGPDIVDEIEMVGLHRPRLPMRVRDSPVPPAEIRSWAEYLQPAGFREALGLPLFSADGRHLGMLTVHTDTPVLPTDAARDLIGALAPTLGHAVDPLRSIAAGACLVQGAATGVVLTRAGRALPLPGLPPAPLLPTAPLLAAGSPVLAEVARQLAGGGGFAEFLWPGPGPAPAGHVRITALGCASLPPHHLVAVVVLSRVRNLRGLSPVQLQMLGLLLEDWPDARVAASLGLPPPTVADHLQRIQARLGAGTRDVAAMRALREGLYVPAAFLDSRR